MKVYYGKEISQLDEPQYSVVQANTITGQVLTVDGNKYFNDSNEPFILIFSSIGEAREFANIKIIENPEIEFNIYDHSAKFIERIAK